MALGVQEQRIVDRYVFETGASVRNIDEVYKHMMRQTRAAIINILASPFIEMARLKGVNRWRIIILHAFPNALSPVINVVAINLAYLVVGVVIVEVVFVYPGLGQLLVDSVSKRDIPVVQASGLIFASVYIGLNLLADGLREETMRYQ